MKYALVSPPFHGGVYRISHPSLQAVYIGSTTSLRRRYLEWLAGTVDAGLAKGWLDKHPDVTRDEWVFEIIEDMPEATREELIEKEREVLGREIRRGRGETINKVINIGFKQETGIKKPKVV